MANRAPPLESEAVTDSHATESVALPAARWLRWGPVTVFAAVEVYALAFWLHAGRREWFFRDDWDFLAQRKAGSLGDLFRPHNEHWVTIPVLVYRFLWWAFGLRTYFPYRLVITVFYLGTAAMLYVVIRRAGVNAWITAAAASAYALFDAGRENAIKPFQMTFTGAVLFGLVCLVLADHDGEWQRRDWLALLAGLASLMMSGISLTMISVVALAVLVRRGWRTALKLVGPLAAVFVIWWLAYGHSGRLRQFGARPSNSFATDAQFVARGYERALHDLGHFSGLGWVLLAVLAAGAPLAWIERRRTAEFSKLAAPAALLAGTLGFLATTALSRSSLRGADYAGASRYVSITVVMVLPAFAVAADALARRWPLVVPVTVALLLAGVPLGTRHVDEAQRQLRTQYARTRATMLSLPRDPLAQSVPRSLRPEQLTAREVTVGWLLDGVKEHRIPAPPRIGDALLSSEFRMSFFQHDGPAPTTGCTAITGPMTMEVRQDEVLGIFDAALLVVPASPPDFVGFAMLFVPREGGAVTVLRRVDRVIQISPYARFQPSKLCVGAGMPMPHYAA